MFVYGAEFFRCENSIGICILDWGRVVIPYVYNLSRNFWDCILDSSVKLAYAGWISMLVQVGFVWWGMLGLRWLYVFRILFSIERGCELSVILSMLVVLVLVGVGSPRIWL